MPIYYQCERCAECCRWPGLVRISEEEIQAMAKHLGISEHEFVNTYTRLRPDRRGLSLTEKEDGSCVFLDGRDCRVQAAKPTQCREFPNGWNFPGFQERCRAKAVWVSDAEYARRTGRDPGFPLDRG